MLLLHVWIPFGIVVGVGTLARVVVSHLLAMFIGFADFGSDAVDGCSTDGGLDETHLDIDV